MIADTRISASAWAMWYCTPVWNTAIISGRQAAAQPVRAEGAERDGEKRGDRAQQQKRLVHSEPF